MAWLQKIKDRLPRSLKNQYVLTVLAFVCWMTIFDRNDLFSQFKLSKELSRLKEEQRYFRNEIKQDSTRLRKLLDDPASLEKFARETYLMKKDNEEIFVIIPENNPS